MPMPEQAPACGHHARGTVGQVAFASASCSVGRIWTGTYPIKAGNQVATAGTKNTSASRIRLIAT